MGLSVTVFLPRHVNRLKIKLCYFFLDLKLDINLFLSYTIYILMGFSFSMFLFVI